MVLVGHWRPKQRHKTVAEKLIDRALVAVHFAERQLKKGMEQSVHGLRPQTLRQGRGVRQIAEEHRDLFALAGERCSGGENFFGQITRRVRQWRSLLCRQGNSGWSSVPSPH